MGNRRRREAREGWRKRDLLSPLKLRSLALPEIKTDLLLNATEGPSAPVLRLPIAFGTVSLVNFGLSSNPATG